MDTESLENKKVFQIRLESLKKNGFLIGLGDPLQLVGVPDRTLRALKTRWCSESDSESLTNKTVFRIRLRPGEPKKQRCTSDQTLTRRALKMKMCSGSDPVPENLKNKQVFWIGHFFLYNSIISTG